MIINRTLAYCLIYLLADLISPSTQQVDLTCSTATTSDIKYRFNVWILVPYENKYKFSYKRVRPAIEKALSDARSNVYQVDYWDVPGLLKSSNFSVKYQDSKCDPDWAPSAAADIHDVSLLESNCSSANNNTRDIDVFIGMTCDYSAGRVGNLADHWSWPAIFPGTRTDSLDVKEGTQCCSTMTRPGITQSNVGKFIVEMFKQFNWNTSVTVYSGHNSHGAHVYKGLSTDCGTMINGITTEYRNQNWNRYTYYDIIDRSQDKLIEDDIYDILQSIKDFARVSVWCVGRRTMRKAMMAAHEMKMTNGEFAFIYVDLYNSNTSYYWTDYDDHLADSTGNPDPDADYAENYIHEALRALQIVTLTTPKTEDYQQFSNWIKDSLSSTDNGTVVEYDQYINPFIGHYYDSMLMFIYGVLRTFCSGETNFDNGQEFARRLWGIEFVSIGRNLTISKTGDRKMDYTVMDMDKDTGKFRIAMQYYGNTDRFVRLAELDWPGTTVPPNVPDCGYKNEFCQVINQDYTIWYILGACAGVLLLACIVMTILFRKMQREKRLRMMMWKVKWDDIEWSHRRRTSSAGSQNSNPSISSSTAAHNHILGKQVFTKTGFYKGNLVAVKEIQRRKVSLDRSMLVELEEMYALDHTHITKFIGANDEAPHVSILTEYCPRGSLQDLLEDVKDTSYNMDDDFKNSLISDIVKGMLCLHRSYFQCHGNLKSSNCLIDSRFVVKLADFGLVKFREGSRTDSVTGHKYYSNKLWTAPEVLKTLSMQGTQKGDIYSFGIIVQEIIYRKGVFYSEENLSPQDILFRVTKPSDASLPFRPTLADNDDVVVDSRMRKLIRRCWAEHQNERPTFQEIQREVRKIHRERNLVDSLLERLEQYSQHLEDKVDERTEQYKAEKERADTLLYQMLPKAVADQLKKGNNVLPMAFESVTIFFSDIVGFTSISHGSQPMQVVNMLNDLYTMFDQIIDKFDVYKVETIGDAYMVVSGLPNKNGNNHAREIARMSLSLIDCVVNTFKIRHMPDTQLKLRVGIHTGPVVAGVVGLKMPRYCLFGDTVNTAARMESNGKPLCIHVSPKTKYVLDDFGTFVVEEREDEVFLKGLGTWKTWWLKDEILPVEDMISLKDIDVSDIDLLDDHLPVEETISNNSAKKVISIVTFETEPSRCNDSIPPSTRQLIDAKKSCNSPQSIMKEPRLSERQVGSPNDRENTKRHRSGVMNVPEPMEMSGAHVVLGPRRRREEHKQKLHDINENAPEATDNHDVTYEPSRKIQFYQEPKSKASLQSNKSEERKSGRDSGIGMGFDNVACLQELRAAETEHL